jgi:hypothetical protein
LPEPFMTRPKQSSDTARRMDEPENETRVALVSTPVVPSNTYCISTTSCCRGWRTGF